MNETNAIEEKIEKAGNKVTEQINKAFSEAEILYFYDSAHLNAKRIAIPRLAPTLRLKSYLETFKLQTPAFYVEGKPVFILQREYPISIRLKLKKKILCNEEITELLETEKQLQSEENSKALKEQRTPEQINLISKKIKEKVSFVESGYSASEIDAIDNSTQDNLIFRKHGLDKQASLWIIATNIITALICILAFTLGA